MGSVRSENQQQGDTLKPIEANKGCRDFPGLGTCFGNVFLLQDRFSKAARLFQDTSAFQLPANTSLRFRVNDSTYAANDYYYKAVEGVTPPPEDPPRVAFYRLVYSDVPIPNISSLKEAPTGPTLFVAPAKGSSSSPCDLFPDLLARQACKAAEGIIPGGIIPGGIIPPGVPGFSRLLAKQNLEPISLSPLLQLNEKRPKLRSGVLLSEPLPKVLAPLANIRLIGGEILK